MSRTKLADRVLPNYSRGEEIFNMTSHIVGAVFGLAAMLICVIIAALHRNFWGVSCSIIYGLSIILLYTMSSIYHGLPAGIPKKVMQVMDHCTIYFLIVGTYVPVTLCAIRPAYPVLAWVILGVIIAMAVIATVFTAIDLKRYAKFSLACYIGMGWCIVLSAGPFIRSVCTEAFLLILFGGILYTVGSVLYAIGKKKHTFWHCVFHVFVLAGTYLHFMAIALYIL